MGKKRLAWKSENHLTSLDGVWGKAAFNEGVQGSNSPLPGTPLQTKTAPATMPHASLTAARDGCGWQSGLDGPFVHCFSTQ